MESLKINFIFAILLTFIIGCGKSDNKTSENKTDKQETKPNSEQTQNTAQGEGDVIVIQLPSMQCGTCKKNIEGAVRKVDGVKEVTVSVKEKTAKVNFDKSKTDLAKIEGVIVMAGYQANDKPANKDAYDKLESCCKVGGHEK